VMVVSSVMAISFSSPHKKILRACCALCVKTKLAHTRGEKLIHAVPPDLLLPVEYQNREYLFSL